MAGARVRRGRDHLRRRAHAVVPAPAPGAARGMGAAPRRRPPRAGDRGARGARTSSTATCGRLCALPGHAGARGALGGDRPRAARTWCCRAWTRSSTAACPRFIEVNSDAPAGFGYGDRMAEVFARLPVFRRFAAAHPARYQPSAPALVDALLGAWQARGGAGAPVVAIVDWADVKTRADQEILRAHLESRGLACFLADPARRRARGRPAVVRGPGRGPRLPPRRAHRAGRARGRGARVPAGVRVRRRRLRELVPLPAVRGQGLLRHPHRRGVRRRS